MSETRMAKGLAAMTYVAGDILLIDDYAGQGDLIGNLIFDGAKARHGAAHNTHSAGVVKTDGTHHGTVLVEAMQNGVERNAMHYKPAQITVVHFDVAADDPRRAFAVAFWEAAVGEDYGDVDWVGLFVGTLFNWNISIHQNRVPICSELTSRATESMTKNGWYYSPEEMEPDDIGVEMGLYPAGKPLPVIKRWGLLIQTLYWAVAPWKHGLKFL